MGLVIQIKAIGDQLLDIDFGWTLGTAVTARPSASSARTASALFTTTVAWSAVASVRPGTTAATAFPGRTIVRFLLFCFSHSNFSVVAF
jgi:hypothetical protein